MQKTSTTIAQFKSAIKDGNTRYLLSNCEIVCQGGTIEIYPTSRLILGHLTKNKTQQLRRAAESMGLRCVIKSPYAGNYYLN